MNDECFASRSISANAVRASAKALAAKLAALVASGADRDPAASFAAIGAAAARMSSQQLDLAQSTVSQHLKVLVEAGLVRFSPERQRSRYEIDREALAGISSLGLRPCRFLLRSRPATEIRRKQDNLAAKTVSAESGSTLKTLRNLWPYMWPADRADLKARVVWATVLPGRRQARAGRRCRISSNGRPTRWPAMPSRRRRCPISCWRR